MVSISISPDCNYRGDAMNITNELNQIKNAIYGKDVRSAIHDAIKQTYDDASVEHDNANMEVKLARGKHNTLNDRLDSVDEKIDGANKQLLDIEDKLSFKLTTKENGINMYLHKSTTTDDVVSQLDDISRCGFNAIYICVYHEVSNNTFAPYIQSSLIEYTINQAKTFGIKHISIKLHIDGGKTLVPNDINGFFVEWGKKVFEYANLSKSHKLESLYISNELSQLTKGYVEYWESIINDVRSLGLKVGVCHQGLFYCYRSDINNLIDIIAVNIYPSLTKGGYDITHLEATNKIVNQVIDDLKDLKRRYPNASLIVSEIGCTRNVDALSKPYQWEFSTTVQSFEPQKIYYKAIFTTLCSTVDLLDGLYFWSTDDKTKVNSYSPFGNPECEQIIIHYLKGGAQ